MDHLSLNKQDPSVSPASRMREPRPWSTEPEISDERQQFLRQRLSLPPDIQQGMYPFSDIPLARADIEWLLITQRFLGK
jgi:hypothetical protein